MRCNMSEIPKYVYQVVDVMSTSLFEDEVVPITFISTELIRGEPSEYYPLGQLGVWLRVFESINFFLTRQLAEDILIYGSLVAKELMVTLFKEEYPDFLDEL